MNKQYKKKHSHTKSRAPQSQGYQKAAQSKQTNHTPTKSRAWRIAIRPLDPLMIRDGRPFNRTPGIRAHTMPDVTPTTLAGTIRTLLYKKAGLPGNQRQHQTDALLSKVKIRGPLYRWQNKLYFARPHDLEFVKETLEFNRSVTKLQRLHPVVPPAKTECSCGFEAGFFGVGCDGQLEQQLALPQLPSLKSLLGGEAQPFVKPMSERELPAYVSEKWMLEWLLQEKPNQWYIDSLDKWRTQKETSKQEKPCLLIQNSSKNENASSVESDAESLYMGAFAREQRTHIQIDHERHAVKQQHLFSTESLVFPQGVTMEVELNELAHTVCDQHGMDDIHPLGGKSRLAHFSDVSPTNNSTKLIAKSSNQSATGGRRTKNEKPIWDRDIWNQVPKPLFDKLKEQNRLKQNNYLRLILATPAYFSKGWKPGWLNEELKSGDYFDKQWDIAIELQLHWACVSRWQPVSGYTAASISSLKEKAVRRMVPAGSVYFFEVTRGHENVSHLAKQTWLQSLSDRNRRSEAHDAEDGYGLTLWGLWNATSSIE